MSPTRASELVRCVGRVPVGRPHARARWAEAAPRLREGRLLPSRPRWPVQEFAESDYCYGVGPIRLRVLRVGWDRPVPHEGDTWLEVQGVVIDPAGREGGLRRVLIRAWLMPVPPANKRPRLRVLRSTPA